jgi:hypothetical protein
VAWSYDEYRELRQSCVDDGLLTKAFGRGNLRITKKGQEVVKRMAVLDEEVAAAVQEALGTPLLERREALVTLLLIARQRELDSIEGGIQLELDSIERGTDLLSRAKATVAYLLSHAAPEERMTMVALADDPGADHLQAFGERDLDETNDDEVERFCERVAELTGGEFVLVSPGPAPEEHILLAHYSGGTGVGSALALVNRQPGQAPTLSEWEDWQDTPG